MGLNRRTFVKLLGSALLVPAAAQIVPSTVALGAPTDQPILGRAVDVSQDGTVTVDLSDAPAWVDDEAAWRLRYEHMVKAEIEANAYSNIIVPYDISTEMRPSGSMMRFQTLAESPFIGGPGPEVQGVQMETLISSKMLERLRPGAAQRIGRLIGDAVARKVEQDLLPYCKER